MRPSAGRGHGSPRPFRRVRHGRTGKTATIGRRFAARRLPCTFPMASAFLSHYRLVGLLGVGGMGEVHRAEDTRLRREVAIKILHPESASSREWLSRFRREARLASALQHPNICTIHELGEHEGQAFIVMERLEGVTVRELIEDGPMAPSRVVMMARQVADALDAAHRRGIIHRDIKPANLFVTDGDHVKVLDFGLARLASDEAAAASGQVHTAHARGAAPSSGARPLHLTQTGMAMGTVFYMSPEQARGDRARCPHRPVFARERALRDGHRASRFEGEDIPQILGKITHGVFVPPRALNAAVPKALDAVIVKLLAADPQQRYQSASDLMADLARADAPSGSTPRALVTAPTGPTRPAWWWRLRACRLGAAGGRQPRVHVVCATDAGSDRSRQHRHRRVREHDGQRRLRRHTRHGAEGATRSVTVPRHHLGRAHHRDVAADGPQAGRTADARCRARRV